MKDNEEMKDLKTTGGSKLLNVVVNGVVLGSVLEGLDEALHIHILNEDIHRNCAKGGHTCIKGSHLSPFQQRNCGFVLNWYCNNHGGCNKWTTNSSSGRGS